MTQIAAAAPEAHGASPDQVASALRGDLGVPRTSFQMLAALGAALTVAATFTTAFGVTGLIAVPATCIVSTFVLAVFAAGYLAMGRRVQNSGAFYALIGTGLGRPAGVAAALVAQCGYLAMQVSLYGVMGVQFSAFIAENTHGTMHVVPPWWGCALAVWALVFALGLTPIKVSTTFLGVLSIAEVLVTLAISIVGLAHPHAGLHLAPLNPARITWQGFGPLSAIVVLGFLGFEQALVLIEETKDRVLTPLRATRLLLVIAAVTYIAGSYAMVSFYGPAGLVQAALQQGPEAFFAMAPGPLGATGNTLFNTSLLAAAVAYHNVVVRSCYSIARDKVLPNFFARVWPSSGVPWVASLGVSLAGLVAILATQWSNWDPMYGLFYEFSNVGGYVIMSLLAVTAVAVIAHFLRNPDGERAAVRLWLPVLAAIGLAIMAVACTANLKTLMGPHASSAAVHLVLALLAAVVVISAGRSAYLKYRHPETYAHLAGPRPRIPLTAPIGAEA